MTPVMRFLLSNSGKLRFQDFTSSGTFTPSSALLARGGQCFVILVGGGGGGAFAGTGEGISGSEGGDAGQLIQQAVTVSGALTVTLGAGGAGGVTASRNGNNGSNSTFGALLTAVGGTGGLCFTNAQSYLAAGSRGAKETGLIIPYQEGTAILSARAGLGWSGRAGGGATTTAYEHIRAYSGGGNASQGSTSTPNNGVANTGGGGGGQRNSTIATSAGAGGSGWCRVIWFE